MTDITPREPGTDQRLLLLAPEDNVVVACVRLTAGETVLLDGVAVPLPQDTPVGFKLARRALAKGEVILKYGAPIGSATDTVARGDIVHLNNMKSDYLPTYTHDGESFTARGGK